MPGQPKWACKDVGGNVFLKIRGRWQRAAEKSPLREKFFKHCKTVHIINNFIKV